MIIHGQVKPTVGCHPDQTWGAAVRDQSSCAACEWNAWAGAVPPGKYRSSCCDNSEGSNTHVNGMSRWWFAVSKLSHLVSPLTDFSIPLQFQSLSFSYGLPDWSCGKQGPSDCREAPAYSQGSPSETSGSTSSIPACTAMPGNRAWGATGTRTHPPSHIFSCTACKDPLYTVGLEPSENLLAWCCSIQW